MDCTASYIELSFRAPPQYGAFFFVLCNMEIPVVSIFGIDDHDGSLLLIGVLHGIGRPAL